MPRVSLLFLFQIISLIGFSLTVVKLFHIGLYKRYLFFWLFLIARTVYVLVGMPLARTSKAYFFYWLFAHPGYWVFYVLVVRELCGLILDKYTGLKTLGRWFMYGSVAVALAVSVLSMSTGVNPNIGARSSRGAMGYVLSIDKGVTISLAVFLLVLLALLSRYPVRLPRNVVVHSFLFTGLFLSDGLTKLWITMFGVSTFKIANLALTFLTGACALAWFWMLSKKGEEVTTHVAHTDSRREERLMSQLNHLNQTLIKSGKS
jgi:hypothetical protein